MGINDRLKRLSRLQGGDPGIFALAVHSFIEGELRRRYDLPYEEEPSFMRSATDWSKKWAKKPAIPGESQSRPQGGE